ncbi:hypothetical protein [uncultured Kordia sp.]|uniref:hypothetical protein n=1 Tax=uncultured Kordia sp. TaxID=507699 RepID=UPI00260FC1E7|nr:hypothetical protein [uncultured Kordia sp.]
MKKQSLKSLSLNKNSVSNLTQSTITGGRTNGVTIATICVKYPHSHHLLAETNTIVTKFVSGGIHKTCWTCVNC